MLRALSPRSAALTRYVQLLSQKRPSKRHIAGVLIAIFIITKLRQALRAKKAAIMSMSPQKGPSIPGFTALSDQIFVRNAEAIDNEPADNEPATQGHPDVVIIFGWGDGLPKHVAKYADGFRALYPRAKQILVLSPIAKAMFSDLSQRTQSMIPIIQELFPNGPEGAPKTILTHTLSNTGAVNYAATINAYKNLYNAPFPHQLLSMDSTPGSTVFTFDNLKRWSRAMALGTAGFFPWPFVVTQSIWAMFLTVNGIFEKIIGRESAGGWSRKAVNNEEWQSKSTRKLYMYSKEDDLISWEDIVSHAAETREMGWEADIEVFEGTGHVGHMRKHGEQYWKALADSWDRAMAMQKV